MTIRTSRTLAILTVAVTGLGLAACANPSAPAPAEGRSTESPRAGETVNPVPTTQGTTGASPASTGRTATDTDTTVSTTPTTRSTRGASPSSTGRSSGQR